MAEEIKREKKSPRAAYGKTLLELGRENKNIVVLDADLSCSTQTCVFAKEFPERFFNVGIAEQDLMTTAAGLASTGKTAFVSTFSMFASGRAWDQVRNTIAYGNFDVKIVATHGGVTVGEDGASHQALEDIAIMGAIPNMVVIIPADCKEVSEAVKFAAKHSGPVYIRVSRTSVPDIFDETYKFDYLKANVLTKGTDATIVTNGETLIEVLDVAAILKKENINVEVISMPVVKPIDTATLVDSASKTRLVITVENHSVIGGLGSAVCETLSEKMPVKVVRIGTNDEFGQSGEQRVLMDYYGLTAEKLVERIRKIIKN